MIAASVDYADLWHRYAGAVFVLAMVASIVTVWRFVGGLKLDEMAEAVVERITR